MTMVLQGESQRAAARPLFGAWEETLIESCLDGSMGEVLAGGVAPVRAAVAIMKRRNASKSCTAESSRTSRSM